MRLPRVRFTVRRMMVAVAIIAVSLPTIITAWGEANAYILFMSGRTRPHPPLEQQEPVFPSQRP